MSNASLHLSRSTSSKLSKVFGKEYDEAQREPYSPKPSVSAREQPKRWNNSISASRESGSRESAEELGIDRKQALKLQLLSMFLDDAEFRQSIQVLTAEAPLSLARPYSVCLRRRCSSRTFARSWKSTNRLPTLRSLPSKRRSPPLRHSSRAEQGIQPLPYLKSPGTSVTFLLYDFETFPFLVRVQTVKLDIWCMIECNGGLPLFSPPPPIQSFTQLCLLVSQQIRVYGTRSVSVDNLDGSSGLLRQIHRKLQAHLSTMSSRQR